MRFRTYTHDCRIAATDTSDFHLPYNDLYPLMDAYDKTWSDRRLRDAAQYPAVGLEGDKKTLDINPKW